MVKQVKWLSQAQVGQRVQISDVGLEDWRKLTDIGLPLGAEAVVLQKVSAGLVLGRNHSRVAIGRDIAARIAIAEVA